MNVKSKLVLAAMAAVMASGTLLVPTVSHAAELRSGYDQVTARVDYADLNLATEEGQVRLERRVRAAVTRMCAVGDMRDQVALDARRECEKAARESADREVRLAVANYGKARRA